jgi:di/tricarboxylate transporter
MSLDAWLSLAATVAALTAMAWLRVPAERALAVALAGLVFAGVLTPERALAGFANAGAATVALLFVVAAGVRRSGALDSVLHRMLGQRSSPLLAQLRLMIPTMGVSAFLNNTPVVAMLLPEVRRWAHEHDVAPSQLLLPLSYAAIIGGMCTLIGTSTNLLIDGLLVERGFEHFGIFWITPIGVPAALAAVLVIAVLGRRLLPRRRAGELPLADPRQFTAELVVEADGPLDGKRLREIVVPGLGRFAPVEIRRENAIIVAPRMDEPLDAGDRLIFAAPSAEVLAVHRVVGLSTVHGSAHQGPSGTLIEAVVGPRCPLIGAEVGDGSFRNEFGAAVIAVARDGERMSSARLGTWKLAVGDSLLLEAEPAFIERHRYGRELFLVSDHGHPIAHARWHGGFAVAVMTLMALAAALGWCSMLFAALAASCALVLGRVIRWSELSDEVEWRVLLAIVCALGLGAALEDSGAAAAVARTLIGLGGSPMAALMLIYLATVLTTELVTNNAAAVLMLPIALDTAGDLEVSPMPFVAVVMIAASASFLTPIGYQTNMMVYGPGGYRLGDFVRMGAPVSVAVAVATLIVTPMLLPF